MQYPDEFSWRSGPSLSRFLLLRTLEPFPILTLAELNHMEPQGPQDGKLILISEPQHIFTTASSWNIGLQSLPKVDSWSLQADLHKKRLSLQRYHPEHLVNLKIFKGSYSLIYFLHYSSIKLCPSSIYLLNTFILLRNSKCKQQIAWKM